MRDYYEHDSERQDEPGRACAEADGDLQAKQEADDRGEDVASGSQSVHGMTLTHSGGGI